MSSAAPSAANVRIIDLHQHAGRSATVRGWVQHLRSSRVTIVETGVTERFWVHHINDCGAAAGSSSGGG